MLQNNAADTMITDSTWRIRKDIPVALIFTMIVQVAVLLIWGAHIDSRVASVEQNKADKLDLAVIVEKMNSAAKSGDSVQVLATSINQQLTGMALQFGELKQEVTDLSGEVRKAKIRQ
jgi:hypothetical protein